MVCNLDHGNQKSGSKVIRQNTNCFEVRAAQAAQNTL
jgi:hypothetical protein